ncbi:hypothetical protein ACFFSY_24845 [Paenibacillus aurantiacus]|uniref:Phospholipid phosphatase n=1 Tax=Paenibacillus aurantiacus TaxID=1936118 RepID=A0ABV5KVC1_9BACL
MILIDRYIYAAMAIAYAILLFAALRIMKKRGTLAQRDLVLLVLFGLFYDNAVIAIGSAVGEGDTLRVLSYPRFWLHAWFTPLLVVIAADIASSARIRGWYNRTLPFVLAWVVTLGLILYQSLFVTSLEVANLKLEEQFGALRYGTSAESSFPVMVLAAAAAVLLVGVILAFRRWWPWLLAGVGVLVLGRAIPIEIDSSALTNIFELLLLVSILFTIRRFDRNRDRTQWTMAPTALP